MSHEITKIDHAVYAINPAWHGLGTVLNNPPTSKKALIAAKLNWNVEKLPISALYGTKIIPIRDKFANVRMDTKHTLGVVGKHYRVLQNVDAFKFMDGLVQDEEIVYESAGSLRGGKRIWLLARMKKQFFVTLDDPQQPYMLLFNSHDGTLMVSLQPTSVRVVCANTLSLAMNRVEKFFKFRHTSKINERIDEAKKALGLLYDRHNTLNEILKSLSIKDATLSKVDKFLEEMFPMPVVDSPQHERIIEKIHGIRDEVFNIFHDHLSIQTKAAHGTGFGLLNSYTYWTDHLKETNGADDEARNHNRSNSAMFGSGAVLKQKALVTVRNIFKV